MNDTAVQPTSLPEQKDLPEQIHLPEPFTVGMWQVYAEGQRAYEHDHPGSPLLARYHGALALIRAGYVHAPDDLRRLASQADQSTTSLAIVGLVVRQIALPIEEALEKPVDFLSPA
ncbi:MAG TPA: hypothetical protein VMT34_11795 [Aggregatilineales bacterium]|nr:hypothetical protein [Aggregatilineales bacterium]